MSGFEATVLLADLKELKEKWTKFRPAEGTKLHIVMGNTACDLDTAACTVAMTVFKMLTNPNEKDVIIPVFNLSREEMEYKTEVIFFLRGNGFNLDDLIYRPDIEETLVETMTRHNLAVTLVDHHYDETFFCCVEEIFDHHIVQAEIPNHISTTILPVGSCATLVMQHVQAEPDIMQDFVEHYNVVIAMCFGAILLDTINFDESAGRFTELDLEIVRALETILWRRPDDLKLQAGFHKMLLGVRNNVSKLTPFQQLHKDFKMVLSLPVCGLTMLVQEFVYTYHPGAEQALEEFAAKMGSTEVVLMGIRNVDGVISRDLGFYSAPTSPNFLAPGEPSKRLEEYLSRMKTPCFEMNLLYAPVNGFPGIQIYRQHNIHLSRKQLIPAIMNIKDLVFPPIY